MPLLNPAACDTPVLRISILHPCLAVRDLPVGRGVKFQIICFGTRHICMNKSSKEYNAESEQHAVKWISSHVRADLGGTEV